MQPAPRNRWRRRPGSFGSPPPTPPPPPPRYPTPSSHPATPPRGAVPARPPPLPSSYASRSASSMSLRTRRAGGEWPATVTVSDLCCWHRGAAVVGTSCRVFSPPSVPVLFLRDRAGVAAAAATALCRCLPVPPGGRGMVLTASGARPPWHLLLILFLCTLPFCPFPFASCPCCVLPQ